MKSNKLPFLIAVLLLLIVSCTEKQTKIKFDDDPTYNLGKIQIGTSAYNGKEWLIRNVGNKGLKIDSVKLSCDCITVMYDSIKTVKPNGYFPFKVFISPDGTIGDFYREIKIYGNFENSPLKLAVEGTFIKDEIDQEQ